DAKGVADHLAHGDQLGDCGNGSTSLAADAITLKATQNPFGRNTSFEFMMEEEGAYQLEIIDRDGNLVAVVAKGISKAGEVQSVVFDRGQLRDGLYIARLVTAKDSKTVRIMVMGR
ncbi:MAG: T9SS type A sorting domain-containing protein, partial [Bacteroidetes bacterium]|nr:T9SS type A sorting domain-containing protein [Bacteroidota bacterium]